MTHFEKDKEATIRYFEGFRNVLDNCIADLKKAKSEEDIDFIIKLMRSKQDVLTLQFEHDIDQYNKEYERYN